MENGKTEGCCHGLVFGTYLHGLFDTGELTLKLTDWLCSRKGLAPQQFVAVNHAAYQQQQFDKLADGVRKALDLQAIYRLMEEYPNRIYALCWIRPEAEKDPSLLYSFLKDNREKVNGLKFHPYLSGLKITDEAIVPYLAMAKELDLPLLVHTAADECSRFVHLKEAAKAHPDLTFVGAHLELYGDAYKAIDLMKDCPNIYADSAWVNQNCATRLIDSLGPTRLLFGTDSPIDGNSTTLNSLYIPYYENHFGLSEEDHALLMGGNAKRIYRL